MEMIVKTLMLSGNHEPFGLLMFQLDAPSNDRAGEKFLVERYDPGFKPKQRFKKGNGFFADRTVNKAMNSTALEYPKDPKEYREACNRMMAISEKLKQHSSEACPNSSSSPAPGQRLLASAPQDS